jgi:hypothetical protein
VVNTISGTLTPVSTATGVAGRPVRTGVYTYPTAVGLTPSGATAVVIGTYAGRATLVSTRTGKVTAGSRSASTRSPSPSPGDRPGSGRRRRFQARRPARVTPALTAFVRPCPGVRFRHRRPC